MQSKSPCIKHYSDPLATLPLVTKMIDTTDPNYGVTINFLCWSCRFQFQSGVRVRGAMLLTVGGARASAGYAVGVEKPISCVTYI